MPPASPARSRPPKPKPATKPIPPSAPTTSKPTPTTSTTTEKSPSTTQTTSTTTNVPPPPLSVSSSLVKLEPKPDIVLTIRVPPRPPIILPNPDEPWKHPKELDYYRPHDWTETVLIKHLIQHSFSVPARLAPGSTELWCRITYRQCGMPIIIPKAYRLPLMFAMKFQWESLKLVLTSPMREQEWADYKFDILHVSRLCTTFLTAARDAMMSFGMDRLWRNATFDRALTRYYRRWLVNREEFVMGFWQEFEEEEYEGDVLKKDWMRFVLKGHKGFNLTKEECAGGLSFETVTKGLQELPDGRMHWILPPSSTPAESKREDNKEAKGKKVTAKRKRVEGKEKEKDAKGKEKDKESKDKEKKEHKDNTKEEDKKSTSASAPPRRIIGPGRQIKITGKFHNHTAKTTSNAKSATQSSLSASNPPVQSTATPSTASVTASASPPKSPSTAATSTSAATTKAPKLAKAVSRSSSVSAPPAKRLRLSNSLANSTRDSNQSGEGGRKDASSKGKEKEKISASPFSAASSSSLSSISTTSSGNDRDESEKENTKGREKEKMDVDVAEKEKQKERTSAKQEVKDLVKPSEDPLRRFMEKWGTGVNDGGHWEIETGGDSDEMEALIAKRREILGLETPVSKKGEGASAKEKDNENEPEPMDVDPTLDSMFSRTPSPKLSLEEPAREPYNLDEVQRIIERLAQLSPPPSSPLSTSSRTTKSNTVRQPPLRKERQQPSAGDGATTPKVYFGLPRPPVPSAEEEANKDKRREKETEQGKQKASAVEKGKSPEKKVSMSSWDARVSKALERARGSKTSGSVSASVPTGSSTVPGSPIVPNGSGTETRTGTKIGNVPTPTPTPTATSTPAQTPTPRAAYYVPQWNQKMDRESVLQRVKSLGAGTSPSPLPTLTASSVTSIGRNGSSRANPIALPSVSTSSTLTSAVTAPAPPATVATPLPAPVKSTPEPPPPPSNAASLTGTPAIPETALLSTVSTRKDAPARSASHVAGNGDSMQRNPLPPICLECYALEGEGDVHMEPSTVEPVPAPPVSASASESRTLISEPVQDSSMLPRGTVQSLPLSLPPSSPPPPPSPSTDRHRSQTPPSLRTHTRNLPPLPGPSLPGGRSTFQEFELTAAAWSGSSDPGNEGDALEVDTEVGAGIETERNEPRAPLRVTRRPGKYRDYNLEHQSATPTSRYHPYPRPHSSYYPSQPFQPYYPYFPYFEAGMPSASAPYPFSHRPPWQSHRSVGDASSEAPERENGRADGREVDGGDEDEEDDEKPATTRIVSIVQDTLVRLAEVLSLSVRDTESGIAKRKEKRKRNGGEKDREQQQPVASGSALRPEAEDVEVSGEDASSEERLDLKSIMHEIRSLKRNAEEQREEHERVANSMRNEVEELRKQVKDLEEQRLRECETDRALEITDVDRKPILENGIIVSGWGPSSVSSPIDLTGKFDFRAPSVPFPLANSISRASTAHPLSHVVGLETNSESEGSSQPPPVTPTIIKVRDSNSPRLDIFEDDVQGDAAGKDKGKGKEKEVTVCPPRVGVSNDAIVVGDEIPLPIKSQRKGRMMFVPIDISQDSD